MHKHYLALFQEQGNANTVCTGLCNKEQRNTQKSIKIALLVILVYSCINQKNAFRSELIYFLKQFPHVYALQYSGYNQIFTISINQNTDITTFTTS